MKYTEDEIKMQQIRINNILKIKVIMSRMGTPRDIYTAIEIWLQQERNKLEKMKEINQSTNT